MISQIADLTGLTVKSRPLAGDARSSSGGSAMSGFQENEGYLRIRQALRDGTLQAGMTVTQSELCDLLKVSLSPLRETLVLLEEFGLVDIKPRAGIAIIYPDVS